MFYVMSIFYVLGYLLNGFFGWLSYNCKKMLL